jgi:hypothetical protein
MANPERETKCGYPACQWYKVSKFIQDSESGKRKRLLLCTTAEGTLTKPCPRFKLRLL